jgi:hypothetical protein
VACWCCLCKTFVAIVEVDHKKSLYALKQFGNCSICTYYIVYFRWQPPQPSTAAHISSNVPANVATTADLENLKKELTGVMQSEIAAAKQEILDG